MSDFFADEAFYSCFDAETGMPTITHFGNAVQVWAIFQEDSDGVTVGMAAAAFNVKPQMILEAVEAHEWMYVSGPVDDFSKMIICHDGE